jgi:hypothetical protein
MYYAALGILLFLSGTFADGAPAEAATKDWVFVAATTTNEKIYIDGSSSYEDSENPSIRVAWSKSVGRQLWLRKTIYKMIYQQAYDCDSGQVSWGPTVTYSKSGSVVHSSAAWSVWRVMVPETIGETQLDFVCGYELGH